jgi:hypothetical protein
MFQIPDFYKSENITLGYAMTAIRQLGHGDVLEGMKRMDNLWALHIADELGDDDEFFYNWEYEVNAYNKVYAEMNKVFK